LTIGCLRLDAGSRGDDWVLLEAVLGEELPDRFPAFSQISAIFCPPASTGSSSSTKSITVAKDS